MRQQPCMPLQVSFGGSMLGFIKKRAPATVTNFVAADTLPSHSGRKFEVNNHILSKVLLEQVVPLVGVHPYPLNELLLMAAAVCQIQPLKIFEWGTHIGISARIFYELSKSFAIHCEIHSTDLPESVPHIEHPHEQRGLMVKGIDGVIMHEGDGLEISIRLGKTLKHGMPVLFFLDGDHEYTSVSRELAGLYKSFPWASILVHDTFEQTSESNYNIGPFAAVREFLSMHSDYQVILTSTGLPGMTLLYKPLHA